MTRITRRLMLGYLALLCGLSATLAQSSTDASKEAQRLARVAQVAQQERRYDDAIRAYRTITVVAANSPKIAATAHLNLGNIYMALGKYEEAAAAFRRSSSLDSESAEAYNNLGEALGELRQYERAIEAFQQAVALDGGFLKARYNMGVTYDRMGQLKYAEFVYRILIRDYPGFAIGYDSLAVTLSKSGRAREALPLHEKAIALDSKDPSFYYNYAVSYLVLGDVRRAQQQQQKLRDLDPSMADRLAAEIAKHQR